VLIECLTQLRNSKTRQVVLFGTLYEFTPLADGRLVAEVADSTHAARFLSKRAYREFTDTLPGAKGATLQAGPATSKQPTKPADPPPPPSTAPTGNAGAAPVNPDGQPPAPPAPAGIDGSQTADEVQAAAQALLSSTPVAIKKQLEKHPPGKAVLQAAIAIENAAKKPRQHVLACLTGTLSALEG